DAHVLAVRPLATSFAQRMIEAVGDAPPRYLLHDRDSIYDGRFRGRLRGLGVRCLLSRPRAPLANAICERLVGTLRRDCLDHVLVFSERQTERIPATASNLLEVKRCTCTSLDRSPFRRRSPRRYGSAPPWSARRMPHRSRRAYDH